MRCALYVLFIFVCDKTSFVLILRISGPTHFLQVMSLTSVNMSSAFSSMSSVSGESGVFSGSSVAALAGKVVSFNGMTVSKLEGDNYPMWATKLELVLESQDLWEVVSGEEGKPVEDGDGKLAAWLKRDKRARMCIMFSVSDLIFSSLTGLSAREMWLKLESVYRPKSLMNKLMLRRKLLTLRMNEGEDVGGHVNILKQCSEQLQAVGAPVSEDDLVMTLLMSLPPSYEHLITSLETIKDSDLTYDYVVAKLLNFDLRKKQQAEIGSSATESAFVVQRRGAGVRGAGVSSSSRPMTSGTFGACHYCKEQGHYKINCPKLRRVQQRAAMVTVSSDRSNSSAAAAGSKSGSSSTGGASDDVEIVFMMSAHGHSSSSSSDVWYIDSACTQHMCHDRESFCQYDSISAKKVLMGDDSSQDAVGVGSIKMRLGDVLESMLLVPSFG